ncbi:DivIVA domain-containing protein [Arthrobacter sp. ISL-85]|uniref:DivIVA domain-containing protein n=1 Tax=Arthrobacter sp. ISL-85 TaxID=2819115 RepID=UPI001BEA4BDA|nr:DivIVA domain-containing protein [Arthrobacter sp. ISL-85]MBT2568488.1 DivIVA domain-containing protein [Arthrobacter sp. ISL-85]
MSFFLVFLAVVLVTAVLWSGLGRRSRKSGGAALPVLLDGFGEPPANLPPVLLPERAVPEDVTRLRFSLGLRGYRMDQVDQVLDELRDQLAARDAELAELRGRLAAAEDPTEQSSDDGPMVPGTVPEVPVPEEPGAGGGGNRGVHEDAAPGKGSL